MKIHFIGIGGIGVSALAKYYLHKGDAVSGSDLALSEITKKMEKMGARVFLHQESKNITESIDKVIYSPAVKPGNPEYDEAKRLGITLQSYPEALAELTQNHYTIAVSGSHGKSTTTSMLALAMIEAGLDPTVIVGTKLKEFGDSNFRAGKSHYLVIEACEYDGSFLHYQPNIIITTNIDKEHLDYFKTFKNVIREFKHFIQKLPADGFLVANKEDAHLVKISKGSFTTSYYPPSPRLRRTGATRQSEITRMKTILKVPGKHNISNALAVVSVMRILGIRDTVTYKALSKFQGTWRRFEIVQKKPYTVISDYGHHPTEVQATLTAAREAFPQKTIWCIFQPHQHQRTYYLLKEFIALFRTVKINQIIITDIYDVAGREETSINKKIDSALLVKKIAKKNVMYLQKEEVKKYVQTHAQRDDVVIVMGAGDIYRLADPWEG